MKTEKKKNAFVICSVRRASKSEARKAQMLIARLEYGGWGKYKVHYPPRDTDQNDPVGLRICTDNRQAIINADEVHVIWKKNQLNWLQKLLSWLITKLQGLGRLHKSEGSYFDLGMAFMAQYFMPEKKIILENLIDVLPTKGKSFENVLNELHDRSRQ